MQALLDQCLAEREVRHHVHQLWGVQGMSELICPTCGGSGQQSVPHAAFDSQGRQIIEHVITTCETCRGNGKVNV